MKVWFLVFSIMTFSSFAKTFEVNTQHSFVNFEVDYMKISVVKGAFEDFKGVFEFDAESNQISDLEFSIKVKSINTRDSKRDAHLHRKDFFHVSEYPEMKFVGKKVHYQSGKPVKIDGLLTMRGVTKEQSFNLDWKGVHQDPIDKKKKSLFVTASGELNRKEFGISWNKTMDNGGYIVGDKVKLEIVIEANPTDTRAAFSRFYLNKKEVKKGTTTDIESVSVVKKKEFSPEKKKVSTPTETRVEKGEMWRSVYDFVIGFFACVGLLVGGFYLKKWLIEIFEKKMSEVKAELLSDTILYSIIFFAAIAVAPYMGYSKYFK